jgi:hypothetical protein
LAPREERERLKPISLYGLDFDTVMRGLLAVPVKPLRRTGK